MRTVCAICGCALVCATDDDSNAFCMDCRLRNFGCQSSPDLDTPRVIMLEGLGRRRAASERILARHREEAHDAG